MNHSPVIGPVSIIGAVMPDRRRPPMNVVVFQCPCGTGIRQRVPRFDRPRRRATFVETAVSSMKTRCPGSRSGWPSNHALRRTATSVRVCSLACAVFFNGHGVAVEAAPDRARRETHAVLCRQPVRQFASSPVPPARYRLWLRLRPARNPNRPRSTASDDPRPASARGRGRWRATPPPTG